METTTGQTNAAGDAVSTRYAWYVVIVLTACYTLSFIDRQILSLLVGPIKKELAISDTRVGLLQGLAFSLFYTLVGLPLGRLADSRNRRNLIGISIFAWSLFTGACSMARSFWSLFLARIGVGVGEAGLSPAAYSLISDMVPKERLGLALSVYYMGVFLGSSLALIVGGTVVDAVSHMTSVTVPLLGIIAPWRITFLIVAAPGVPFAFLVATLREPIRRNLLQRAGGGAMKLNLRETLREISGRWSSVVGIGFGMIFQASCNFAFMNWSPTYFARIHHWTPGETGRALGLILATFGCAGIYLGGFLSDRWLAKGVADAPLRVAIPAAIGTAVLFPLAFLASSPYVTLALFCPAVMLLSLPMGTALAAVQFIFPNQLRAQVSALVLFFLNLGALTLGPLMPGLLNDRVFHSEAAIGKSLAITIGVGAVLMLISFGSTLRPYRKHYRLIHP